jgi:hypothetical protein
MFGCVGAMLTLQANLQNPWPRDFAQAWFAARAVLDGANPYLLIGPGLPFDWPWPFLYPLPAALVAIPFSPLSQATASILFFGIGSACFAWALMQYGYGPLFGFFGGGLHYAAEAAQWSPLLAASVVVPPIGFLLVAKPTVGLAMFAARPSRWAVAGALSLCALALLLQPTWIHDWLGAIATNSERMAPRHPYRPPVFNLGGVFALLCLTRWQRPEARLVAVLACMPQTSALYETVPLFLVPQTFVEAAVLVGLSYAHALVAHPAPMSDWATAMEQSARWIPLFLYIPVTVMILRRPNDGPTPQWLESAFGRWSSRLRGTRALS